ncbi:hypothetical protein NE237_007540 [Protea cynaroides]|uniref:Uncharacterized protein n=1 Tax=Protea cynaroides TaxID=273540 RepID=A0A9Q0KPM8_9MAGN|nr:hypothetical protein NE237_007540 [Protea cynaroides]
MNNSLFQKHNRRGEVGIIKFSYIKPVQTGSHADSDSRFVFRKVFEIFLRRRYPALVPVAVEVLGAEMVEGSEDGLRDLSSYEERIMQDSDSRFVYLKVFEIFLRRRYPVRVFASNHALKASVPTAVEVLGAEMVEGSEDGLRDLCSYEERRIQGEDSGVVESKLVHKTIYLWKETISPHLAAER